METLQTITVDIQFEDTEVWRGVDVKVWTKIISREIHEVITQRFSTHLPEGFHVHIKGADTREGMWIQGEFVPVDSLKWKFFIEGLNEALKAKGDSL